MMYVIDEPPQHCPQCSRDYPWEAGSRSEFYNGCSQVCRCGARFQYLHTEQMLEAAKLNPQGDLRLE